MAEITVNGTTLDDSVRLPPDASRTDYILVQVPGALTYDQSRELSARGAHIRSVVSRTTDPSTTTYLCRYAPASLEALEALSFVSKAIVYHPTFSLHPDLKKDDLVASPKVATRGSSLCQVEIRLHEHSTKNADEILDHIRSQVTQGQVETVGASAGTARAWVPVDALDRIAAIDDVDLVYPAYENELDVAVAREILGLTAVNPWDVQSLQQGNFLAGGLDNKGEGVVVAVRDSGFSTAQFDAANVHPAFKRALGDGTFVSRVKNTRNVSDVPGQNHTLVDDAGHGTLVAGSVAGVYCGAGPIALNYDLCVGTAPEAEIYVQSYNNGILPQLALDELTALQYRVHIQNNSFGEENLAGQLLTYATASATDQALYEAADPPLHVQSAGNAGGNLYLAPGAPAGDPTFNRQLCGKRGAKNVLTVGTTWNTRGMAPVGDAALQWNDNNCVEAPDPQRAAGALPGHHPTNTVAYHSSKGPTADGFLKPDVVAPGVGILTTMSLRDAAQMTSVARYPQNFNPGVNVAYATGNSFSTPQVSGVAACLHTACVRQVGQAPTAIAMKAMLINGAVSCQGGIFFYQTPGAAGAPQVFNRGVLGAPPDCVQGHGRVDARRTLAHPNGMVEPRRPGVFSAVSGWADVPNGSAPGPAMVVHRRYFSVPARCARVSTTFVFADKQGANLQFRLSFTATLERHFLPGQQQPPGGPTFIAQIAGPRQPDPPQVYANYQYGPAGAPAVHLGNVQKITWPTPLAGQPAPAANEEYLMKIEIRRAHTLLVAPFTNAKAAVAWLSEFQ